MANFAELIPFAQIARVGRWSESGAIISRSLNSLILLLPAAHLYPKVRGDRGKLKATEKLLYSAFNSDDNLPPSLFYSCMHARILP